MLTEVKDRFAVVDSARRLAIAEHAKQRHGDHPYSYHLVAVAGLVSCYTNDPDIIAAAWLHDIVEDCEDIDLDTVEQMTNRRVRDMVDLLTDPPGPRSLAKQVAMQRIVRCKDAALIKQCDRFHNHASTLLDGSVKYAKLYADEGEEFITAFERSHTAVYPLTDQLWTQWATLHRLASNS